MKRIAVHSRSLLRIAPILSLALLIGSSSRADQPHPGEAIYRRQCAECHGTQGEGSAQHEQRLTGDKSVEALTAFIEKSMPEESPEECAGEEARHVAAYIYNAFYSPLAQARIEPPRIALSHLTVRQHQQALSDLVGGFRSRNRWDVSRGLQTEYFNSGRRIKEEKRVLERTEGSIQFNYGSESPPIEKLNAKEFSIRWTGGIYVPETGEYEFVTKANNGVCLWVNDDDRPLIDAWVRSGKTSEYRESVFLLGGRVYPLRVEFFKSEKDPQAAFSLSWKRPGRVVEVISRDFFAPGSFSEQFVPQTPLPEDDRSLGYERGTSISRQWDEATTYAAIETAGYILEHLDELAETKQNGGDRNERLRAFCLRFAERAFRAPLSDELRQLMIERRFEQAERPEEAVKRSVLFTLKSPRFLYVNADSKADDTWAVAERLALGLWDSLPDEELHNAAAGNQLQTEQQIALQAERMLSDRRAEAKLTEFFHQWLNLRPETKITRDAARYPEFSEAVVSDLRESLNRQMHEVFWSENSDFRQLWLSDSLYLNGRLAKLYGAELSEGADFQLVRLADQQRSGILTHPLVMTSLAHNAETSPIHRGVFLARNMLGRRLLPPQEAFELIAPEVHPEMTTRQRVALQTESEGCQKCHVMINPLGFSLEHFDAIGRFRQHDNAKPVDAAGVYLSADGQAVTFTNAAELARFAADSREAQQAFIERLFHHVAKQPMLAYGEGTPERLRNQLVENNFNMRKLLIEIAVTTALRKQPE